MIDIQKVTIGSYLITNRNEVIEVESISTKRQHRKLGYHDTKDRTHIKYVRLGQVEGIRITPDILLALGFYKDVLCVDTYKLRANDDYTITCSYQEDGSCVIRIRTAKYICRTLHEGVCKYLHEIQGILSYMDIPLEIDKSVIKQLLETPCQRQET